jgi:hypothetical protein
MLRLIAQGTAAALAVLATHSAAPLIAASGEVTFFEAQDPQTGQRDLVFLFDSWSWYSLTGQVLGTRDAQLALDAEQQVRSTVNHAMKSMPHGCAEDQWLVRNIAQVEHGHVALVAFCAADPGLARD